MSETIVKPGPASTRGTDATKNASPPDSGMRPSSGMGPEKLVLSPEYRVPSQDVFVLQPEHAVKRGKSVRKTTGALPRQANSDQSPGARTSDVRDLTAKIAALELAIAKTVDQWEPDGTGADAYAGTSGVSMAWPESGMHQSNTAQQAEKTHSPSTSAEAETATSSERAAVPLSLSDVDEAMLRKLVAETVRSELQGALGERITRNVRKLVRREIQNALAARSIE